MNIKRPPVSVVIPHYNQNTSLNSSVVSVASQLREEDEILIVDDCSKQVPVIEHSAWLPSIRIITLSENSGPGAARNTGVEQSKHDYVAFLDADDIALSGRIAAQLSALQANSDWVGCVGDYIYQRDEDNDALLTRQKKGPFAIRQKLLAGRIFAAGSTLMVKRQNFLDVGGYNPALRVYEDWDLLLRMTLRFSLGHCGKPLALISPSTRRANLEERLQILTQLGGVYAGSMDRKEYRSFMQALAYERASAYFRAKWMRNALWSLLIGFIYAPITLSCRLMARIFNGVP